MYRLCPAVDRFYQISLEVASWMGMHHAQEAESSFHEARRTRLQCRIEKTEAKIAERRASVSGIA